MRKTILAIFAMTIMLVSAMFANATPTTEYVKINGDVAMPWDQLVVERGDTIDIRVRLNAWNGAETNVNVEAYIDGYEYADKESVSDSSENFDMDAGDTKTVDLSIKIPVKAEKDYYDLKVRVGTRRGYSEETIYRLNLKGKRHEILIKDILMPSEVKAGRGLFANVKVENVGQKTEKDITVRLKIPDLKIEEFTTIDALDNDDSTTSEDLVAMIPECTKPGKYDVVAEINFDNDYDKVTKTEQIEVVGSDICEAVATGNQAGEKTVISVPQAQEVAQGNAVAFPIMIQNMGSKPKTYVITVSKAVDAFGEARIEPSNVVIVSGQKQETVFVYVKADANAQVGQKDFAVTITSGDEKKDVMLSANVVKAKVASDLKNVLEVGLVLLVIILVIIGLVIGFNKLKPKEDEKSEIGSQTYY